MADPTPIPAEALAVARAIGQRAYEAAHAAGRAEESVVAFVNAISGTAFAAGLAAGRTAAADAVEAHAESIGWYESSGVWAEAIEIARGADQ